VAPDTIIERMRAEKIPFDVFVCDIYWRAGAVTLGLEAGAGRNLDWDRENVGEGKPFVETLRKQHVHVCLHLNTRMWSGEVAREGLERGYMRRSSEEQLVEKVADPRATDWAWQFYRERVLEGVDAWWTDNGERVDGALTVGLPSRNLFGHLWNKSLFDGMRREGREGRLVLSRGGWIGAQRHTLTWPGDTAPGTERLKEDLRWHLNCSTSGIPFNTVDFGGFVCYDEDSPNPEHRRLYFNTHCRDNVIRRIVHPMLLFTTPRIHGGGPARLPWRYDDEVRELYLYFLNLRYRLFPYLYALAVHSSRTGEPIYRPLVWEHPDDPETCAIDDQIYLGDGLMFAPVVEEGADERELYLPEGEWKHLFTGRIHAGGRRIVVNAPLLERSGLPAFMRRGAIIPMRRPTQFCHDEPEPGYTVHIYPAEAGEFQLHEDPATSGRIRYSPAGRGLEVSIENPSAVDRSYTIRPAVG